MMLMASVDSDVFAIELRIEPDGPGSALVAASPSACERRRPVAGPLGRAEIATENVSRVLHQLTGWAIE